jgi:hypothetical protein
VFAQYVGLMSLNVDILKYMDMSVPHTTEEKKNKEETNLFVFLWKIFQRIKKIAITSLLLNEVKMFE